MNIKEWDKYEKIKQYLGRIEPPYYDTVNTNWDFYTGNQWKNVVNNQMPTPVFNIIKRAITFFVSSICSQDVTINYEELEGKSDDIEEQIDIADVATAEVGNLFDKFKMENVIREALTESAITGDIAAHMYFDMSSKPYGGAFTAAMGEIKLELIDGCNVYFGNPNNDNVEDQPYIIISGRDTVENIKREYMQLNKQLANITEDSPSDDMAGYGKQEITGDNDGKVTYILTYSKVNIEDENGELRETIYVSKCLKDLKIYEKDTGLNHYPIAWYQWEKQKNIYHGRALCTGMIPNQIFINKAFAMCMLNLMQTAFPKAIYDKDKIKRWDNMIGSAVGVSNVGQGESIRNCAAYLEPGNMSNQITQVIEMAIQHTKDSLGINDVMLGNINPEQASGKSIIATVQQSQIPLESQKSNLYVWIEEIGVVLLDMMGTYYGDRPVYMDMPYMDELGQQSTRKELMPYDFNVFKDIYLNCRCDVGASSYWSEIAGVETLDNLLQEGRIDFLQYLESLPEGYIQNKQQLIDQEKLKVSQMAQMPMNPSDTNESQRNEGMIM